jgi:DNA repair protein RecO (recombination protein O)
MLLRELGYLPRLETCATCGGEVLADSLVFSAAGGGVLCQACQAGQRERRSLSKAAWQALQLMAGPGEGWRDVQDKRVRAEIRQLLNHYVTYVLGRRPRLLAYLKTD